MYLQLSAVLRCQRQRANRSQRNLWKPLTEPDDFFKDCFTQAVVFLPPEGYARQIYVLNGQEIVFHDMEGKHIWSTKGDGQILLPARVSIAVKLGKIKYIS